MGGWFGGVVFFYQGKTHIMLNDGIESVFWIFFISFMYSKSWASSQIEFCSKNKFSISQKCYYILFFMHPSIIKYSNVFLFYFCFIFNSLCSCENIFLSNFLMEWGSFLWMFDVKMKSYIRCEWNNVFKQFAF